MAPGARVLFQSMPVALSVLSDCFQTAFHRLLIVPLTVTAVDQLPVLVPVLVTCTRSQ